MEAFLVPGHVAGISALSAFRYHNIENSVPHAEVAAGKVDRDFHRNGGHPISDKNTYGILPDLDTGLISDIIRQPGSDIQNITGINRFVGQPVTIAISGDPECHGRQGGAGRENGIPDNAFPPVSGKVPDNLFNDLRKSGIEIIRRVILRFYHELRLRPHG